MDDGLSLAVRKVFVDLYKDGLIYRDKRLVNWDPKLHTAISDLEVEHAEVDDTLVYARYPFADGDVDLTHDEVLLSGPDRQFSAQCTVFSGRA